MASEWVVNGKEAGITLYHQYKNFWNEGKVCQINITAFNVIKPYLRSFRLTGKVIYFANNTIIKYANYWAVASRIQDLVVRNHLVNTRLSSRLTMPSKLYTDMWIEVRIDNDWTVKNLFEFVLLQI